MSDKLSSNSNEDNLLPPVSLTPKQIDLSRRLDSFYQRNNLKPLKPKPSEIFRGAIYGMQSILRSNPDWMSQVANSLRELLYPVMHEVRRYNRHDRAPLIKNKFKEYGYVLIEDVFDEINEVYGRLNDLSHHGLEPQNFTEEELRKFSEADFEELVKRFEDLMFQAFTLTLDIFEQIDQLFSKNPAQYTDREALNKNVKRLIRGRSAKEYFYYKANKRWINWLRDNGFLDVIKQKAEDPTRYGYRTPEINYLVRMTEKSPAKVVDFILTVPVSADNFNPEGIDRFLHICSNLSARQLKRLVNKIRDEKWAPLMGSFNQWGFEYEKMFKILNDAKDYRSILILAEAVLSIRTKEEIGKSTKRSAEDNPFYFNDLSDTKVFEHLANIPDEYAERALALVTKVMTDIVLLSSKAKSGRVFLVEEAFHLYDVDFFTLELSKERHLSCRDNVCEVAAVTKVLIQRLFRERSDNLEDVRSIYYKYIQPLPGTHAMWRLRLFVLSLCPEIFKEELKTAFFRLFGVERYYEITSGAEYKKALQKGFLALSEGDKHEYAKQVITYFTKHAIDDDKGQHLRHGSTILSMIANYLDTNKDLKQQVEKAGFKIDRNYEPIPTIGPVESGFVVPRGPITPEEFSKLSTTDIANKLRTNWTPEKLSKQKASDNFFNPLNAEGAGKLLQDDMPKRIQDYVENAGLYFERNVLDQHYTYCFLKGIQEAIKSNKKASSKVNWDSFIGLCLEVKKQGEAKLLGAGKRGRDSIDVWLAGWDAVHSGMTDVLQELLSEKDGTIVIDYLKYREHLFEIISYLLDYPDPTPGDEQIETAGMKTKAPGGADFKVSDPFTMAINSVRGRAFQAFVLFVYQDGKKFKKEDKVKISTDVKELYENVLQKENTRALMFMFGHYLPTFYFRDKEWILELLPKIFPKEPENKRFYTAAWEGYIVNNLYEEIFFEPGIQELYEHSITLKKDENLEQEHFKQPDEGIATHFALAYAYYKSFDLEHWLLKKFWAEGTINHHLHFVSFIGRSLISSDNNRLTEAEKRGIGTKERIKELWDWMLENYEDPAPFVEFGFWIYLEKEVFKSDWLAERVKKTLEKTKGALDWEIGLTKSIVQLAKEAPADTLEVSRLYLLEGGIHGGGHRSYLYLDKEWFDALKYLYANPEMKSGTYALIDELIREGGSTFWKLKEIIIDDS